MPAHDPLMSVATLAGRLHDADLRVVDVRWVLGSPGAGRARYVAGHIPGAVHVDVDADLSLPPGPGRPGRHPLPPPATVARRLGDRGIGDQHEVVAYDDAGGWIAARLWWMLDDLGHERVSVLDGGIGAWVGAGLSLSTEVPEPPPARLSLATDWRRTIDREALRARLGSIRLLDARAGARYRGEIEPIDPVAGHIPTAVSAPTDGNLAPDGRFLERAALVDRYRSLGADGTLGDVVTSCGSGVAACHNALAMRAAGLPDPVLYVGSFSDWTRHGYPVATGPDPGDPV